MKIRNSLIILSTLLSIQSNAKLKVLYGSDDRKEVDNHPSEILRNLSKSVAGRVNNSDLRAEYETTSSDASINSRLTDILRLYSELGLTVPDDTIMDNFSDVEYETKSYSYRAATLKNSINACSTERFLDQPTLMSCTGFLVGKDLLVTAGHCMRNNFDCSGFSWVFDFKNGIKQIPANNVYKCEKIVSQELTSLPILGTTDYALIKLDREVTTGRPLKFRTSGRIKRNTSVAVIGHPLGLPLKIADNAKVKGVFGKTFKANLDTYGGNSGSPVVDAESGLVEGILVHGADDLRSAGSCTISRKEEGSKEGIYKITRLKFLQDLAKSDN